MVDMLEREVRKSNNKDVRLYSLVVHEKTANGRHFNTIYTM